MCQYEIQEQREVPALYTGIHRLISSTGYTTGLKNTVFNRRRNVLPYMGLI
jgi:hypothetical protein